VYNSNTNGKLLFSKESVLKATITMCESGGKEPEEE
jgi:hypothetical protein